jgi:antitoxin (DNA-binding transcriptional repressor) of toxin-antitoxin stability system
MRTVAAGEFKAKCLAMIDEVKLTSERVVITKRGVPMAQLAPLDEAAKRPEKQSILGSLRGMATIHGDIVASEFTDEEWNQMSDRNWVTLDEDPQ